MKIPLSWLREFTDVQLTAEQLADALTLRGLEVRGVERWGANWNKMVVGELLDVQLLGRSVGRQAHDVGQQAVAEATGLVEHLRAGAGDGEVGTAGARGAIDRHGPTR